MDRRAIALCLLSVSLALPLCAAGASPLTSVTAMAWLGGWESLRAPSVAAPATTGETQGDLEKAFHVAWHRDGDALRVKVTKLEDAWVGRLAVDVHFAADTRTITYGNMDVPVPVPVAEAKPGQVLWSWEYGLPGWLVADSAQGSAGIAAYGEELTGTARSHGFFMDRLPDSTFSVHLNLDWPRTVGQSLEYAFRMAPDARPAALQADRRKRLGIPDDPPLNRAKLEQIRKAGFVRVDPTGWGFATGDGKPVRILGQNTPHLALLAPAEQEKILAQSEAAGVTLTRFLIADYAHRPMGAYNDEAYRRLIATVDRCASHGIRSVICLEYSGCGDQYNLSIHRTKNWSDLYLIPEMLSGYEETIRRVVAPLRDNPAALGYDVTNEPDLALSPVTPTQSAAWHTWLQGRYGTIEKLREAWGKPDLAGFDAADNPKQDDYDWQKTQQARDFLAFGGEAIGRSMIGRAKLVRAADPRHLLTISAWDPRLLRGLPDAGIFDYWAPHSYEIYFVGPEISEQVMYQVGLLRRALPDRPRPVAIEEFGLTYDGKFPPPVQAAHCRGFLDAGERWGAGIMVWDLLPEMLPEYTAVSRHKPAARADGPKLAFWVAPSEECRVLLYPSYMWRRKWGRALAAAQGAGFTVQEVTRPADAKGSPSGAAGSPALLVLGDDLTADEAKSVRAFGLPVVLTDGAAKAKERLGEATMLPADAAGQVAMWKAKMKGH